MFSVSYHCKHVREFAYIFKYKKEFSAQIYSTYFCFSSHSISASQQFWSFQFACSFTPISTFLFFFLSSVITLLAYLSKEFDSSSFFLFYFLSNFILSFYALFLLLCALFTLFVAYLLPLIAFSIPIHSVCDLSILLSV